MEAELHTDFGDLGLDPEGAYIVVISGEKSEDPANQNGNSNSRVSPEIDLEGPPLGSGTYFEHTYDGTTYQMRYITVTAAENSLLGMTSEVDLLEDKGADELMDVLSAPLTIVSSIPIIGVSVSLLLLINDVLPDVEQTQPASCDYRGASNWTIQNIQVKLASDNTWRSCASVEYVTLSYFTNYTYYEPSVNRYQQVSTDGIHGYLYSTYYNDSRWQKDTAAQVYEYNPDAVYRDKVPDANYKHDGEVIITHQRPLGID